MRNLRVAGWIIVVLLAWGLDITAGVRHLIAPELHGLTDCATACLTIVVSCWIIARHALAHLQAWPGQRVVSDAEAERMENAAWRAAERAEHGTRPGPAQPHLRRVAGDF